MTISRAFILCLALLLISSAFHVFAVSTLKPRLVVLTDIAPHATEPDDHEALIRLFAHADLFEIEAIIATTGWNTSNYPPAWMDSITTTISAYERDVPNLRKRSGQTAFLADESKQEIGYWPSPAYLRSRTMLGSAKMGLSVLGDNNNSAGSNMIIQLADDTTDQRPIWITVWGGGNTFAQAIWRVQKERTADQLKAFLHKCRIYTITDQDKPYGSTVAFNISSHQWMRKQFAGDLTFIWDECAWLFQNSNGVNHWTDYSTNIQGHGSLGAAYPKYRWGVEGDNPSYIYLLLPGLSDPDVPPQCSWGGYFEWQKAPDTITNAWTNQQGTPAYDTCYKYVNYFSQANFNNFAARMDWAKSGAGNRNPVVVINNDSSFNLLTLQPLQGSQVVLDASNTYDPDGNTLTYKWWVFPKAGTLPQAITISNATSNRSTVAIPANSAGKTFHVICEVTDNGTPALTSYRRIIFQPVSQIAVKTPIQRPAAAVVANAPISFYDLKGRKLPHAQRDRFPSGIVLCRDNQNRLIPRLMLKTF